LFDPIHIGYQYHLQKKSDVLFGRTGAELVGEEGGGKGGAESASTGEEQEKSPTPPPTWWTEWIAKTLLNSPETIGPSSKNIKILVLGDVQQQHIDDLSDVVSKTPTTTLDYCSSRLVTSKQRSDMAGSDGRIKHVVGHAHVVLSTMLVESHHSPVHDVILVGDVGGDAATALLSLCLSFSLLKVGGVMASVKCGDDVQLAMDGLCDCYEPHLRLVTSKRMNIIHRIDESKVKKKEEFRNH
jgi:hypothetical protein